ncbi:MAG: S53 family peptidase [Candidatus Sulfotelmatobacter sp.]
MPKYKDYTFLPGSERVPLIGAQPAGAANSEETLQVTVLLRAHTEVETATTGITKSSELSLDKAPCRHRHLSHQEFLDAYGASSQDLQRIEEFAHEYNLTIVGVSLAKRTVMLAGTVASFARAFQVELKRYEQSGKCYRGRIGPIQIPAELSSIVKAVMGLDNRPQARPHFRMHLPPHPMHVRTAQPEGTFTPAQVAGIYGFPKQADGAGQCIAIVELGGGFRSEDITHYFLDILKLPVPRVVAVAVDGSSNAPAGTVSSPDAEVMLDIAVAGAVAPRATIAVYFAPNTDQGFYNAIAAAVHDTRYNPGIISISWGGPESTWSQQSLTEYNNLLQDAVRLGVTVCVASGDNGSTDGLQDGLEHVDFPASSPFVLACGGTSLKTADGKISQEVVWNEMSKQQGATGGGVSDFFPKPTYQASAGVPPSMNPGNFVGRGVPDVAGNADPLTGYDIYLDGQMAVLGGTSAVAPLWAGLVALINQIRAKRAGNLNPLLYNRDPATSAFYNITAGNNGAYSASPGWSPCTGWGSPNGASILSALDASQSEI